MQIASSGSVLPYQVISTITSPVGGFWLQVPTQQSVTPGNFTVSVNTQGLTPGSYTGTIIVSSATAGSAGVGRMSCEVNVPLTSATPMQGLRQRNGRKNQSVAGGVGRQNLRPRQDLPARAAPAP